MTKLFALMMLSFTTLSMYVDNSNHPFKWIYYYGEDVHYITMKDERTFYLTNDKGSYYYKEQGVIYADQNGQSRLLIPNATITITSTLTNEVVLYDSQATYLEVNATDAFYYQTVRYYTNNSSYSWTIKEREDLIIEIKLDKPYQLTLEGIDEFETYINNANAKEEIINQLYAYSSRDGIISQNIKLESSHNFYKKLGVTELSFSITDSLGIVKIHKVKVLIVDNEKPVINDKGQSNVGYSKPLTIEQIKNQLEVTDNLDQIIRLNVLSDNYTSNSHKIGKYTILFSAVDASGNETLYHKEINVYDDKSPTIIGPNIIETYINMPLSKSDILEKFVISDEIDVNSNLTLDWIDESYFNNKNKVGRYYLSFKVSDLTNNESFMTFEVVVNEFPDMLTYIGEIQKYEGDIISENEVSNYIKEKGYDVIKVTSNEINYEKKLMSGIYRITFKIDESEMNYQLLVKVSKKENIVEESTSNIYVPIVVVGAIIFIVSISSLIFVIRKKKNQKL